MLLKADGFSSTFKSIKNGRLQALKLQLSLEQLWRLEDVIMFSLLEFLSNVLLRTMIGFEKSDLYYLI